MGLDYTELAKLAATGVVAVTSYAYGTQIKIETLAQSMSEVKYGLTQVQTEVQDLKEHIHYKRRNRS